MKSFNEAPGAGNSARQGPSRRTKTKGGVFRQARSCIDQKDWSGVRHHPARRKRFVWQGLYGAKEMAGTMLMGKDKKPEEAPKTNELLVLPPPKIRQIKAASDRKLHQTTFRAIKGAEIVESQDRRRKPHNESKKVNISQPPIGRSLQEEEIA